MSEYVAPQDWTGPAADRPGLMWRKAQITEHLTAGPAALVYPDRVLAHRRVAELPELAMCGGAKLLLGVTKKCPAGQLGARWSWRATHGFGQDGATGVIRESVALALDRPGWRIVTSWSRPVPDPRLMHALGSAVYLTGVARPHWWPLIAAVLAQLPTGGWTAALLKAGPIGAHGRFMDIPRTISAADAKREIRI